MPKHERNAAYNATNGIENVEGVGGCGKASEAAHVAQSLSRYSLTAHVHLKKRLDKDIETANGTN